MATQNPSPTRSAFFYGTLMAPSVLQRVTNSSMAPRDPSKPPLHIRPAILPGFRRHRVKYADYPAIVPVQQDTATTQSHSEDPSSASAPSTNNTSSEVRGTYVTGLVMSDIRRLDAFEGSEYERRFVRVKVLPQEDGIPGQTANGQTAAASDMSNGGVENGEMIEVETYVWIADPEDLEDREWDFDEFVRERLWVWAGGKGDSGFEEAAKVEIEKHENGNGGEQKRSDPTGGRSVNGGEFERMMAERE